MAEASRDLVFGSTGRFLTNEDRASMQDELGDSSEFFPSADLELARIRKKQKRQQEKKSKHKKRTSEKRISKILTTANSSISSASQDSRRYRNGLNPEVFQKAHLSDDVISLSSSSMCASEETPPRRRSKKFEIPNIQLIRGECFRLINHGEISKQKKNKAVKLYKTLTRINRSLSFRQQPWEVQVIYDTAVDCSKNGFSSYKTVGCIMLMLYGAADKDEGIYDAEKDITVNVDYDKV
jgi:hypothetical protein